MPAWKQAEARTHAIVDVDTTEVLGEIAARGWWEAVARWHAEHPEHATRHLDAQERTSCPST